MKYNIEDKEKMGHAFELYDNKNMLIEIRFTKKNLVVSGLLFFLRVFVLAVFVLSAGGFLVSMIKKNSFWDIGIFLLDDTREIR